MKGLLLIILVFVVVFLFSPSGLKQLGAVSQTRYSACDLCGYCPPDPPPSTWESCRKCLYPNASNSPPTKATLVVDPASNTGPTPYPGRQYTVIGCIKTDLASFSQQGAAAGVVQTLLNIIFGIIGGLAFLYLIYGSFVVLTSQAEPERLNYGKRLIIGAVVGAVFSLLSVFIVNFLASGILRIPGF
ncbi:hypothetical protein A2963_01835 [Candidatus Roizmanbacteria bacterium RIFCSPLOWO2_01_FULL_40_13]|nr:MAG: hypothetical protein A2963_01835 [Candidatus Roizmanbacteria bacterium RIFCSPLOWO2_01_FULL_40_13]